MIQAPPVKIPVLRDQAPVPPAPGSAQEKEQPLVFKELLTKWLRQKLEDLKGRFGEDSPEYRALYLQYVKDPREDGEMAEQNARHYEAGITFPQDASGLPGLERFYRRAMVIEPTLSCAAHCRYCLRAYYSPKFTMSDAQMDAVARYCGSPPVSDHLREVLVTGGDPLVMPHRLETLFNAFIEHAPNVQTIRLATRIPTQDPLRIDQNVLRLFHDKPSLRFELATQINHPVEFFPEVVDLFKRIMDLGVKVYSQNVLLRGVNDDVPTLVELYDTIRRNNLEAHYLFHAIPLRGTHHLRTSLDQGLKLATRLTSGGHISGRAKPMFAVMTDIGKVVLYHGTILQREGRRILLQTGYRPEERLAWNPTWQMPESAELDDEGYLRVWYLDGED
jgi:lysine 2,3-aminomutase